MKILRATAESHAPRVGGRFVNRNGVRRVSLLSVLRWQLRSRICGSGDERGTALPPTSRPSDSVLAGSEAFGATWFGHATTLIHLGGFRVLTDPIGDAPPGMRRLTPCPVALSEIEDIDAVVVTHNHYDHMDASTLREVTPRALCVVPLGLGAPLRRLGAREVVELDWGDCVETSKGRITLVPAVHWSRRGITGENRTLWGGYVIESSGYAVYFSGDSAWGEHFGELSAKFDLDLAVLPVGAFRPRNIMANQHIDPREALAAFIATGAAELLPVHWGTFDLSDDGPSEGAELLRELVDGHEIQDCVRICPIGGTLWLER